MSKIFTNLEYRKGGHGAGQHRRGEAYQISKPATA
jgi:hypothetical protein